MFKDGLISKSDFDSRRNAWATADAGLTQANARVAQAKAQNDSASRHIAQAKATLTHYTDLLQKTTYPAPFDGVITNLPVREGETVVIGIQNAQGSTLMTIADMSVITAEVKVDETDIVNVKLGQPADVTIDAIPKKIFHGKVTEIGNNAIVRSSGVSTSQQTTASEEAKDFKVVVTLSDRATGPASWASRPPRSHDRNSQQRTLDSDPGSHAIAPKIRSTRKITLPDRYTRRNQLPRKWHPRANETTRSRAFS